MLPTEVHQLLVFASAFGAGMINSVAGGGTLLSFPTLIWLGVPSVAANATSTVALWPGTVGSVWGYRRELREADRSLYALSVPSLAGGLLGAILLSRTPTEVFDRLVPLLIFFATCLLAAQEAIQRRFDLSAIHTRARSPWLSWAMLFQAGVGLYGGYFGAGIGILMLAALSLMGHTDIHRMNAVKNALAVCINGIAAVYFVVNGLVIWDDALVMAAGAIIGGVGGAGLARRMGRTAVRRIIIAIGFGMAFALLVKAVAARGGSPAAFDGRCIPAGCVAPHSNTPGILNRRALPAASGRERPDRASAALSVRFADRPARLGATRDFHHGLL